MNRTVSVIIPSYNRRQLLAQCLSSVEKQDYAWKEIIVVDDGSSDGTLPFLQKYFPGVKIIRNPKPLGPSNAKNQGIVNSNGDYVYFLDSDSELVSSGTVSAMVETMEADSGIGMLGGILELNPEGEVRAVYGYNITYDGRSYPVALKRMADDPKKAGLEECDFLPTCNCFVPRHVLFKTGGFDPYYLYMGEDKELGAKIKALGYRVCFSLKTSCLHYYDESVKFDRRFMYLKNKLRFAIKNKGLVYFFVTPFLDLFFFFIYYPLVFLFKGFNNKISPNLKMPDKKWILFSVFYFLKAYALNFMEIPNILRCRSMNFLSSEQMKAYA